MLSSGSKSFLQKWGYSFVVVLLTILIFSPVIQKVIFEFHFDYDSHIYWAEQMLHPSDSDNVPLDVWAHGGWHFLVILFSMISLGNFPLAGFMTTLFSIVLMSLVAFESIRPTLQQKGISLWWGVGMGIGTCLVAPIYIFIIKDNLYYFGYIGITNYHNPTNLLLKPLAVLVFFWSLRCFQARIPGWRLVLIAAVLSILATFTKPSYAICFLPAFGLLIIWSLIGKKLLDWTMITFGFILPTVLVLAFQYWMTYASSDTSSVVFAPFSVMNLMSGWLGKKFLISIFFPALVTLLYLKDAVKDIRLQLAWVTFAVGAFFIYFVAESGRYLSHGNFAWGGEIALLILFVVSNMFFLERIRDNRLKTILIGSVWVVHVLFGIGYYLRVYLQGIYT